MDCKLNKKIRIILIGIIVLLIVAISAIVINTVNNKKSKQVYSAKQEENKTLIVELNEALENMQEENIAEEINEEINEENNIEHNNVQNNGQKNNKNTNGKKYKLEVNCEQNVVNVYEKDENGEYTKCVKAMLCSIGTATPRSGTYTLTNWGRWTWLNLQGGVCGQYATQITGNILFHSVPYTENGNKASLEYWEYDKLGTAASLGCIRLTVQNAKWIYNNCMSGTKVTFYNDSNPGPLGKPSERKISSEEEYRNWDPTDPDSNNPWKNYKSNSNNNNDSNNTLNSEYKNEENNNTQNDNTQTSKNEINNNEINNNESSKNNEENNDIIENNLNNEKTNSLVSNVIDDSKNNITKENVTIHNLNL